ncbi:carbohydrate ABC transporter permease [Cohnella phaseoli]|uniref:Putative aldouronate transport system permease protein n=1 Tax=Cohnella phaseoli TaxID=456490 RepID=A0A3D9IMC5_9BACL|nr:carbohydrate ABC transporter permease [Cohnella phaseoli]RED62933.1 putative aldouronate transport system permease protein [Cohnella phaseoli]
MHYKSASERTYQIVIHLIVISVAISAVFPLLYVIGMSLTTKAEMIARNYFVIIPLEPTLEAYKRLLASPVIWNAFVVSTGRAVVGPLLTLLLTTIGAYVLAQRTLPGRGIFLFFILATILFNGGLIPTYLVIKNLGLIDSYWSLILPIMVDSFGLLVIKIFIENLPDGLTESAKIDGAGEWSMLLRIIIPLAAPALAAIGLFNLVAHWNSWFDALLYLNDKQMYPLQMVLKNMLTIDSVSGDSMNAVLKSSQSISTETLKMAAVVIGIIPVLCVYPFLQKHFVKGMYMGSVKG